MTITFLTIISLGFLWIIVHRMRRGYYPLTQDYSTIEEFLCFGIWASILYVGFITFGALFNTKILEEKIIKVVQIDEVSDKHSIVIYDDNTSESIVEENEVAIADRIVSKTITVKGFKFCGIVFDNKPNIQKQYKK